MLNSTCKHTSAQPQTHTQTVPSAWPHSCKGRSWILDRNLSPVLVKQPVAALLLSPIKSSLGGQESPTPPWPPSISQEGVLVSAHWLDPQSICLRAATAFAHIHSNPSHTLQERLTCPRSTGVKTCPNSSQHTAHNHLISQLLDNAVKWSAIQRLTYHLQIPFLLLIYANEKGKLPSIQENLRMITSAACEWSHKASTTHTFIPEIQILGTKCLCIQKLLVNSKRIYGRTGAKQTRCALETRSLSQQTSALLNKLISK